MLIDRLWNIAEALVIFGGLLLSASCTTTQVPKDRIVEVDKPVAVQPITKEQIPALPPPLGPRPPTASQAADAAFAAHCADVAWIIRAFPLLEISAGLAPTPAPRFPECEKKDR
jgi:hypothetical protein